MDQQNRPQYNVLPSSTLALISLVAGILGFTFFPFVASIIAVWTGYAARKETRSVPPMASGDGMATAGIVMGWIQIGFTVISLCCVFIYFVVIVGWLGASGELGSISG